MIESHIIYQNEVRPKGMGKKMDKIQDTIDLLKM